MRRWVRGLVLAAPVAIMATHALPGTGTAQSGTLLFHGLSAEAMERVVDPGAIATQMRELPGDRVAVIIELAVPELPELMSKADGLERDQAQRSAIRASQDGLLARVFGSPQAAARAEDEAELSLKLMRYSPLLAMQADRRLLRRLAEDRAVTRIHLDGLSRPMLGRSAEQMRMQLTWEAGATGEGFAVAVLDTGARRSHEFFTDRVVSAACYNTHNEYSRVTCPNGAPQSTDIDSANDCNDPQIDGCGHGTHVSAIAMGRNDGIPRDLPRPLFRAPQSGVAPQAQLISINVFSRFPRRYCGGTSATYCLMAYDSDVVRGLERVFELRHSHDIAAVNLSLGGGRHQAACPADPRGWMFDQLLEAGILSVAAAGNDGFRDAIVAPACVPSVISVANADTRDEIHESSNWSALIDVAAPGIVASAVSDDDESYDIKIGTSMAAPQVAGLIAALRTAVPDADVDEMLDALMSSGLGITESGITRSRVVGLYALQRLRGRNNSGPGIVGRVTQVSNSCALTRAGTAWCWGVNNPHFGGAVGDGSTSSRQPWPVRVTTQTPGFGPRNIVQIARGGQHACALTSRGRVFCWGGGLGRGERPPADDLLYSVPWPIDTSQTPGLRRNNVVSLSAGGNHSCALTDSGRAFCWGSNQFGQLGDGSDNAHSWVPVRVQTRGVPGLRPNNVVSISAGTGHTCALNDRGRAYCWGDNRWGQLGDGTTESRNIPVPVDTGTTGFTGRNLAAIAPGGGHTCALTDRSRAFCWGANRDGQLGTGTTEDSLVPVPVSTHARGLGRNIRELSAGGSTSCAITERGRAYCWGSSHRGGVGDGGIGERHAPVPVNTETPGFGRRNVATISAGPYSCAATGAGRLFCWGYNRSGQLGIGTHGSRADRYVPTPVLTR